MIVIDDALINPLTDEAIASQRKRKNHNFHKLLSDPINRMLNALEPGSYVQPHKHENPDKREVFLVLRGALVLFYFDDNGAVTNHVELNRETGCYGVEVEPRRWHSIVSLQSGTVVYEIKDGPYNPMDDKIMAPWAPKEEDVNVEEYLTGLLNKIGLFG